MYTNEYLRGLFSRYIIYLIPFDAGRFLSQEKNYTATSSCALQGIFGTPLLRKRGHLRDGRLLSSGITRSEGAQKGRNSKLNDTLAFEYLIVSVSQECLLQRLVWNDERNNKLLQVFKTNIRLSSGPRRSHQRTPPQTDYDSENYRLQTSEINFKTYTSHEIKCVQLILVL